MQYHNRNVNPFSINQKRFWSQSEQSNYSLEWTCVLFYWTGSDLVRSSMQSSGLMRLQFHWDYIQFSCMGLCWYPLCTDSVAFSWRWYQKHNPILSTEPLQFYTVSCHPISIEGPGEVIMILCVCETGTCWKHFVIFLFMLLS